MSVVKIPEDFNKIIKDFMTDLFTTFPEYKETVGDEMMYVYENENEVDNMLYQKNLEFIFTHCQTVFPERFFDILYKNDELFLQEKTEDNYNRTDFFPNVDFRDLWKENISDKTKEILWKYLQITLFNVVNVMNSENNFGDTAKLFEAIGENELQDKMKEAFDNISNILDFSGNSGFDANNFDDMAKSMMDGIDLSNCGFNFDNTQNGENGKDFENNKQTGGSQHNIPNPEELQDHIKSMLNGKIGRLAQDIAVETAKDIDFKEDASIGDAFEKMIKNPGKLLNLVKSIGTKIDDKIKSGELKESELMQEATEMMNKMKTMPGMNNMEQMLNQMAGSLGGKNAKFNKNMFNQKQRCFSQKEKMLQELERRKAQKRQTELETASNVVETETEELKFTKYTDETSGSVEKSSLDSKAKRKRRKKKKGNA